MRNIVLVCASGMSTSILVNKMKDAAKEQGYDCEIDAHPIAGAESAIPGADCVLLGPQVRFQMDKLQKQYPDKKIDSIDMRDYGTMNGKAVLEKAKKIMGDM